MKGILVERNLSEQVGEAHGGGPRSVSVNLAESPLGWLHAHRRVTDRQRHAGEALRRDYERAALPQRTTMMWDAPPANNGPRGPSHDRLAGRVDAKRRFDGAIAAAGPGLADILWRVVCAGESIPGAEEQLGWPRRSGRLVLTLALDRVADYYRIQEAGG